MGRKGLVWVILSPPQTQTLFKICTTRIFALFQPPSSYLAAAVVLCPALWDTVATQCSVPYLFQSLNSLSMYFPLPLPLLYFALVLAKISWKKYSIELGPKYRNRLWWNTRKTAWRPENSTYVLGTAHNTTERAFSSGKDFFPRKCITGMAIQLEGVHIHRTKDASCTEPCITATCTTWSVQMYTTDLTQGSHWYLSVRDLFHRLLTSNVLLQPLEEDKRSKKEKKQKKKPTETRTQPFVFLQQHHSVLPSWGLFYT